MKNLAFLLVLLFAFSTGFAQKNKKEIIYLKNGSVLKGRLVQIDDDKVAIQSGKNIWVFNDSEIDTVASKWQPRTYEYVSKPWFLKTTVGILAGGSDNQKPTPLSVDASLNVRLFPGFYLGAGTGVDFLAESYLPLFGNLEIHFRETRFTPFLGMKGGYMFPLDDATHAQTYYAPWSSYWPSYIPQPLECQGGLMYNPSFGFVSQINENLGVVLSFGYRFHQLTFEGENEYELERNYHRLSVRLGFIFN